MAYSCTSDLYTVSTQKKECSLFWFSKFIQEGLVIGGVQEFFFFSWPGHTGEHGHTWNPFSKGSAL